VSDWGPFALNNKVAVVTGGAAGIGLGIVQAFGRAGASVMAVGRREDGEEVIAREAPGASFYRADLSDPQVPERIILEAVKRYGLVDILVNNAAMLENRALEEITADYIDAMSAVNIRASILLIKAFAHARKQSGAGGRIINIGSLEGFVAALPFGMGVYGSTKTAIRGMTVSLARELGPSGIGVNCVAPGAIVHENLLAKSGLNAMSPERLDAALAQIKARTNVGRLGVPQDIGNVCVFLASEASSYISGQTILVDGGTTRT